MTAKPQGAIAPRESLPARLWRLSWLMVVVATVLLSMGWWLLEPGGFGIDHPRFWANSAAPVAGLGVSLAALWALRAGSKNALRWLLSVWPAAGLGAAVAGRLLFPATLGLLWLVPLATSATLALTLPPLWRAGGRIRGGGLALAFGVGLLAAGMVCTQYPPKPRTRPSSEKPVVTVADSAMKSTPAPGLVRLGLNTTVHTAEGSLMVRLGSLSISATPLLTFLQWFEGRLLERVRAFGRSDRTGTSLALTAA